LRRLRAIGEPRPLLRALQHETVAQAKLLVPRKTGNLGRSIVPGSISGKSAIVEVNAKYAAFVEFPTKPHIIRPRNRKALAFPASASDARLSGRTRVGGRRIFARVVHHPGTKAQPFLLPGARNALKTAGIDVIVSSWNGAA